MYIQITDPEQVHTNYIYTYQPLYLIQVPVRCVLTSHALHDDGMAIVISLEYRFHSVTKSSVEVRSRSDEL